MYVCLGTGTLIVNGTAFEVCDVSPEGALLETAVASSDVNACSVMPFVVYEVTVDDEVSGKEGGGGGAP